MGQQSQFIEPTRLAGQGDTPTEPHAHSFVLICSHELRNSLSGIRNAASILNKEISPAPTIVRARVLIERQVAQMARLIDDLLDVSGVRGSPLHLQRERVDLRAILEQTVQAIELTLRRHDHRLTTSLPGGPVWLYADSSRLEQVFVNLLINAVKYTDAGGDIELSLQQEADEAVVRIRDTGIGIPAHILPYVFDLYFQGSPASHPDAGLGVGLALVRSLVERHGGTVAVSSAGPQQGSEFTIRLRAGLTSEYL